MARNGTQNRLSPKQEAVALALASGQPITEAARACSAGERTIKRWLAESEDFRQRVSELRGEMIARALGRLADSSVEAVETLRQLLGSAPASVRLGSARAILELGSRLRESVELEQRIAALEARQNGRQHVS